ncbi:MULTISPECIES: hypothetical protein [unclassified Archaeoglobus]|jgi:hypothetical protein|uniref:hypothetical protein n=1 Tax=unclassified Archaeoglobus TaxID=2643606 RepID=UPI0025BB33C1|nr:MULTISPECIES: hypothetical protein [unclassified Archaeoglobus]
MPKKRPVWGTFWLDPDGFFGLKVNNKRKLVPTLEDLLDEIGKEVRKVRRR